MIKYRISLFFINLNFLIFGDKIIYELDFIIDLNEYVYYVFYYVEFKVCEQLVVFIYYINFLGYIYQVKFEDFICFDIEVVSYFLKFLYFVVVNVVFYYFIDR